MTSLLLLLVPVAALADGKVFPPTAVAVNVTIPDQRALIHFTNGMERLVIETRFTGSGTNFAWVVPLPNQPVVEEASTGLFPTLQYLFQPRVVHYVPRYYIAILAAMWACRLLLFVRPTGHTSGLDWGASLLLAVAIGGNKPVEAGACLGFLVFIDLMCIVLLVRLWGYPELTASRRAMALAILGIQVVLVVMVLPAAHVKTKGMSSAPTASAHEAVSILDRQLVGVFETTTIASRDPKALQSWLRENGFAASTNSEPVIESYVKDGWVFVAANVRRDDARPATSTPHPLSFTFKTDKPVYPMRLTGVDNGPLRVELYVFGPARAKAPHFKAERCTQPAYPEPPKEDYSQWL